MNTYCSQWQVEFNDSCMSVDFGSEVKPVVGGVRDYSQLENKPQINGVTLVGNKTNEELDIKAIPNSKIEELLNAFV